MDIKPLINAAPAGNDLNTSLGNEKAAIEALLEECKQKQIVLNQHQLILSAVKEASTDPTLEESVKDTVNRVLAHAAFVKNGSPKNFLSNSVIEKNAAAKLSYSASGPFKKTVEGILSKNCNVIIDKFNKLKERPSVEFNADEEKIKLLMENQMEVQKADQLLREEQDLLANLIELRQQSLEDLQNSAHFLAEQNRLLALKSKVEALTYQKVMLLDEDKDLPQAVAKLAAFWESESEKSEAAVRKAEQCKEEYEELEKDGTYTMLLKEYLRVLQQTKHLETALEKL